MRTRLLALACLSVVVAGCGTGTVQAAGGQAANSGANSAAPAATSSAAAATVQPRTRQSGAGGHARVRCSGGHRGERALLPGRAGALVPAGH